MNRKDEHVTLAKTFYQEQANDFDEVHLIHHSLGDVDVAAVDLSAQVGLLQLKVPFYINAMTGGSEKTGEINHALAIVARETGLMMATGSVSAALKDAALWSTFQVIREENKNGLLLANISPDASVEDAQRAVDKLQADGLQIHLNLPQELVMPEGSRSFSDWTANIQKIIAKLKVPVIVKEVGFGMSRETIQQLLNLGVRYIDVSGRGGTSFTKIENARREKKELAYLTDWGQSTVISLLEANEAELPPNAALLASGGVRNAYDIFKALCLGANAVGISGRILNSLLTDGIDATIALIIQWQAELRLLYTLVGARTTKELTSKQLIITGKPKSWCEARNIDVTKYSMRK